MLQAPNIDLCVFTVLRKLWNYFHDILHWGSSFWP